MTDLRQNPDDSWSPSEPLPLTNDFEVEVYGTSPWKWEAWVGHQRVAVGRARTRPGLYLAILRARLRCSRKATR